MPSLRLAADIDMTYFPFAEYWWFYLAFTAAVVLFLALDLGVFHRAARPVSFREAALWSVVWVSLAAAFNFFLYWWTLHRLGRDPRMAATPGFDPESSAREIALQFTSGYLVEKALSLDNIFVFVVIFRFFGIPALYQRRVLFYGIFGALALRGIFIAAGAELLQFHWMMWLFGGFLILTGIKMAVVPDTPADLEKNPVIRLFRRVVPVTPFLDGHAFFTRSEGVVQATPLLLALVAVEVSDIVFAVDSVPAIFALTREPLIVFTSNVMAILGLRALYFLLAGAVERFSLLKYGLAAVLIFVGLKMVWLNEAFGGEFPIGWSLGIIGGALAASIVASLVRKPSRFETCEPDVESRGD